MSRAGEEERGPGPGRHSRKTMLDDCKGERLEDLLAAFSSAVLKKVVSQESAASGEHPPLALSIALENRGYAGDKTELSLLVLAHKASLHRLKRHKEVNAAKFRDFADLLGVKERTMVRKKEEARLRAEKGSSKTVSDEARLEMWRTLRNNWSGNERWMETLLYGDASVKNDGPFGMPFERMWRGGSSKADWQRWRVKIAGFWNSSRVE
uniref:HAUS augmin-like complex subunit 6 N-terminal domain-containing protein n=1 Tax=Bionectria ochroleuca TaxID=29856 RepID=A0A8H7N2C7_BIOOC